MAKYNIVVLERINKDNLIVEANRITKQQPPTSGDGGHGDGEIKKPKQPSIRDLILALTERVGNIEQRLDEQGNLLHTVIRHNNLKTE